MRNVLLVIVSVIAGAVFYGYRQEIEAQHRQQIAALYQADQILKEARRGK